MKTYVLWDWTKINKWLRRTEPNPAKTFLPCYSAYLADPSSFQQLHKIPETLWIPSWICGKTRKRVSGSKLPPPHQPTTTTVLKIHFNTKHYDTAGAPGSAGASSLCCDSVLESFRSVAEDSISGVSSTTVVSIDGGGFPFATLSFSLTKFCSKCRTIKRNASTWFAISWTNKKKNH